MRISIFESIIPGLDEAIKYSTSKTPILKRHFVTIKPVKRCLADDVKRIRRSTGNICRLYRCFGKTVKA